MQYTFVDVIYSREVPHMQSMQMQREALGQSVPKWTNGGHLMVHLKLYELWMCEGLMCLLVNEQCCMMGKMWVIPEPSQGCPVLAMKAARLNGPLATVVLWIAALRALS